MRTQHLMKGTIVPAALMVLLAIVAAAPARSQTLAFRSRNLRGSANPSNPVAYSVKSADLNGDGKLDLVAANHTFNATVFIANGDGTFKTPIRYWVSSDGGFSDEILIADLNGDGKLDLGVTNGAWFFVVPGNGDGTFGFVTPADRHVESGQNVITGDLNGDGKIDLIGRSWEQINIALGNGDGTFREQSVHPLVHGYPGQVDRGASSLVAADFNHDGKLDLAATNIYAPMLATGNDVSVLFGNGDGTFQPAMSYAAGVSPVSLVARDLNGDGSLDLAVTHGDGNTIGVLMGNADGTFRAVKSYQAGKLPAALVTSDLDGDGLLDLAVTNRECFICGGRVSVLRGNGDGTFQSPFVTSASPKTDAQSIISADFDGDGRSDLAVGSSGYLSVMKNQSLTAQNPLDSSEYFVRQHYFDFLRRDPDQGGLNYWTARIDDCNGDPACVNTQRITVSAAFFVEQEFQDNGSFIYRMYRAALNRRPTFQEFGQGSSSYDSWRAAFGVETARRNFSNSLRQRLEFQNFFPPAMSNSNFVNLLFNRADLFPFVSERQQFIDAMNQGASRADIIIALAELPAFKQREYNPSFVAIQYFDYLRRDPDEVGYNFWLNILNDQPDNYRGMVCAFITSTEYQLQFGSAVTHSNAECGP
jgi:FG-GAP-like repeat/Domain of unknown function (DUF4214)